MTNNVSKILRITVAELVISHFYVQYTALGTDSTRQNSFVKSGRTVIWIKQSSTAWDYRLPRARRLQFRSRKAKTMYMAKISKS